MKASETFISGYLSGDNGLYSKGCLSVRVRDDGIVDLHIYGHRHIQNPTEAQFIELYNVLVVDIYEDFLNKLYNSRKEEGIDLTYSYMFDLLKKYKYADCDELLNRIQLGRVSPAVMLSILTITSWSSKFLKNRDAFYQRVEAELEATITPIDRVPKMLQGLK